ncbi:hypothetical protein KDM41_10560 [bacterium]|nr:hypothetical protein [bacterium]
MTARESATPDRFVRIGEVVKAIGLKGELKLYPLIDFRPELLDSAYLSWADGSRADIVRHRPAGACEAITVAGVADRNAADAMVGRELGFASRDYLAPDFPRPAGGLPFRWVGRDVRTVAGEAVGRVSEVRLAGASYLLVVPDPRRAGQEILIPAVAPILAPEDELEGTLVIDPPEGLLDVQHG